MAQQQVRGGACQRVTKAGHRKAEEYVRPSSRPASRIGESFTRALPPAQRARHAWKRRALQEEQEQELDRLAIHGGKGDGEKALLK